MKLQKPIIWIGSSLQDLKKLPNEVRREIGHALHMEEIGERYYNAKILKGFSGVIEIIISHMTNTYRAVYAIKLDDKIYTHFRKNPKEALRYPKKN